MAVWDEIREGYEAGFDARREVFGEDLCNIYGPTFVDGGAAGDSVTFGTLATNVKCLVNELSASNAVTVIGGESYVSSHTVEMKRDAIVDAVGPRHKIIVHARDGKGQRIFERPIQPEKSFQPLAVFRASLVRQGYQ